MARMTSLEICAGAGGQALGLERAGFSHAGLVEIEPAACATLRANRPSWKVHEADLRGFDGAAYRGVDLLAGGVPCPPFSYAGRQLGADDDRDLFPEAMRLVREIRPRAVMLENVRGFLDERFASYRGALERELDEMGYEPRWRLLNACDFGLPQLRPRVLLVAIVHAAAGAFEWPAPIPVPLVTVGTCLVDLMAAEGWEGAADWARAASGIGPTLVGGSKKHGGPDLGPTRAKREWAKLAVDGNGLADRAPAPGFVGLPRLTVRMAARLQGFPDDWIFSGGKTASYRQVGNAFPPPVSEAVGLQIARALGEATELPRHAEGG